MTAIVADNIAPDYGTLVCPRCNRALNPPLARGEARCAGCGTTFELELFAPPRRAFTRQLRIEETTGARPVCGNHARNVATESCSRCGMFICDVCAITADGAIFCPACYERLSAEGALEATKTKFRDVSGIALTLAVGGIFVWFLMPLFGLGAVVYGIRAIRQNRQLQTGSGCAITFAIVLGLLEIGAGAFFVIALTGAFS